MLGTVWREILDFLSTVGFVLGIAVLVATVVSIPALTVIWAMNTIYPPLRLPYNHLSILAVYILFTAARLTREK